MSPDQRLMDSARRMAKTLYVVAGFYVAVGLAVSGGAALTGDRLSTFLGFLIVSGALGGAVMLHSVIQLQARLGTLGSGIGDLRARLQRLEAGVQEAAEHLDDLMQTAQATFRIEPAVTGTATWSNDVELAQADNPLPEPTAPESQAIVACAIATRSPIEAPAVEKPAASASQESTLHPDTLIEHVVPDEDEIRVVDLAALGTGEPELLAAATLDRDVYPRLLTAMEQNPPPPPGPKEARPSNGSAKPAERAFDVNSWDGDSAAPPAVVPRQLLGDWKAAMAQGDLATCRGVFAALVDTSEPSVILPLSEQLAQLTEQTRMGLRVAFAERVREGDAAGAILVGEQIVALFPKQSIAAEFQRLRPHLIRRLRPPEPGGSPRLTLVH